MDDHIAILLITVVILGYGYISELLSEFNISGPMVFTTVGILLSSLVFGVVDCKPDNEFVTIIAEIALIIVLFSDASGLNLKELRWNIPARLLFIGLPLTIVLSTIVGMWVFPDESFIYILLLLVVFMVFGFAFVPSTIMFWDAKVLIYAVLSLTVLRMLPVALSLIGTKLDMASVLFIGWFGPRGIASVLYILVVVHDVVSVKGHETIYGVATLTIFMSIFLHGLSARPLVKLYSKNHHSE